MHHITHFITEFTFISSKVLKYHYFKTHTHCSVRVIPDTTHIKPKNGAKNVYKIRINLLTYNLLWTEISVIRWPSKFKTIGRTYLSIARKGLKD